MELLILIPAAGAASRMRGADKLLEPVDGLPLLRRQAAMALHHAPVLVTLPPDRPARQAALDGLAIEVALLADAAEGMAASMRAGARAAAGRALMVLPGDMPDLGAADLAALLEAHARSPAAILRGTAEDGTPGHPVLFPPDVVPDLTKLQGDQGARSILARHADRVQAVPLAGRNALTDLDTPEAWADWRANRA